MHKYISCETVGGVGLLTLNSEQTLNALSAAMIDECHEVLKDWKAEEKIKCVFLQGAGDKAFCAGGDVRQLRASIVEQPTAAPGAVHPLCLEYFIKEYQLDYEVHRYPKPIVVWASGIVMGGGIGFSVGASHRVATEKSILAMPEISIGLYPDVGGTWFLNRMPAGFGSYIGMTGTRLDADDCLYLGLGDFIASSNSKAELLNRLTKANWQQDTQKNSELITEILKGIGAKGKSKTSAAEAHLDFVAGFQNVSTVSEFREKLLSARHQDEWIDNGIKTFEAGSPSSVHITFEQLRRGRNFGLEEVFRSELNLSIQCTLRSDFAEGVRALLVDKDKAPKWQPATLEEITKSWVESYFTPLWPEGESPLQHLGSNDAA
ncbi:MAG TPA: enoyl-CoA hydratase/isomerase family protein [Trichormus sp.]